MLLGLIAGSVAYQVATWPDVAALATQNPSSTAFIDRYRAAQRRAGKSDRVLWQWVPDDRISPHLQRAVIAAEDIAFFSHRGFDLGELRAALRQAARAGAAPRGAATLTPQRAKNLWLSPSRNPLRKLKEAILTRQLESHLTKRRILELHLNGVEFGPGVYGAQAAAEYYFGKAAADLSEQEAALLAASLPRPRAWNPKQPSPSYHAQVARIQDRMARATFLWRWVGRPSGSALAVLIDSAAVDSLVRSIAIEPLPLDTLPALDSIVWDSLPLPNQGRP
ncbi:MAG: monofunctional biosynthetic peptidoglycan transglycosylase [Gemmatimonadetes bacterium]|nr:monofunctional biosynthetic peptidoglycan transglycosylase [Gemmatimonadota bacterium]